MRRISCCSVLLLGFIASACGSDGPTGATDSRAGAAGVSGAANPSGAPGVSGAASGGQAGAAAGSGSMAGASAGGSGASPGGAGGTAGGGGAQPWPIGDPGTEGDVKVTLTNLTKQPELGELNNPKGHQFTFKLTSQSYLFTESTIAVGSKKNQPRDVWVYVPNSYVDGTQAPLMVIQDGQQGRPPEGRYGSIKYALDNLTVSKDPARRIPAFIAIAVQDGGGDGPNNERGLEYDTVSERYGLFIQNEVIPAVVADAKLRAAFPNFKLTANPEGKATFGCSSGGAAALTMAWFHPELFGRVVTYSGTFVALQNGKLPEAATYPHGAWDYHHDLNLIANTERKQLRIFNNANENDNGSKSAESGRMNWLIANEKTHEALAAKGYHNRYVYGVGAGHCDDRVLEATLADTLVWVWRGYPVN